MNISLENINFCYQPSPPKPRSHAFPTSRWKPCQAPSAPARLSPPTSPIPSKPCVPTMANIPTQNGTPGTSQHSQDLRVSSSGSTTAVRNEFDIEFEETCPVENSLIVSEKGPEINNTRGLQDKNVKDVFSSQNAPSAVAMLDLQWTRLIAY